MSKGNKHDPLAQLDRARCYERRGREFESLTGHTRNFGRLGVCAGLKILRTRFESARFHLLNGVGSSVGRAPGCGSGGRGFEPHLTPFYTHINLS